MRLSSKLTSALTFLVDVATNREGAGVPVTLKEVSERSGVSDKYLWQVVAPLKKAGLVDAVPGANGGYLLVRSPDRITLREIVDAVEGLPQANEDSETFEWVDGPIAIEIWREVSSRVAEMMEAIPLSELVRRAKERQSVRSADYCI